MTEPSGASIYLCPRCLTPGDAPGPCPECGAERLGCRPGDADDPCRRPLMDANGRVLTRAPLWWLLKTMPEFSEYWKED